MQCGNCGHELTTGASFCGNCGAQIAQAPPPPTYGVPPLPPTPHQAPQQSAHHQAQPGAHQPGPHAHPAPPQQPIQPTGQYPGVQPVQLHPSSKYNEMAIIALVILFFFPPASLVLGIMALSQIKHTHERGRGLAIASIVVGGLIVVLFVLIIVAAIAIPETSTID